MRQCGGGPGRGDRSKRYKNLFRFELQVPVSLPGTFPDCSNLKETVSRPLPLPVSFPGSFPDFPGLRPFAIPSKTTIMDPVSGAKEKSIINPTTYVETVKGV